MTRHETVATFALADKAKATELRDRLLAEGRFVWLQLDTGPNLAVSVVVEMVRTRPHYTLAELLARCDQSAPMTEEDREWVNSGPMGNELI